MLLGGRRDGRGGGGAGERAAGGRGRSEPAESLGAGGGPSDHFSGVFVHEDASAVVESAFGSLDPFDLGANAVVLPAEGEVVAQQAEAVRVLVVGGQCGRQQSQQRLQLLHAPNHWRALHSLHRQS